jgi:hypothetical protein
VRISDAIQGGEELFMIKNYSILALGILVFVAAGVQAAETPIRINGSVAHDLIQSLKTAGAVVEGEQDFNVVTAFNLNCTELFRSRANCQFHVTPASNLIKWANQKDAIDLIHSLEKAGITDRKTEGMDRYTVKAIRCKFNKYGISAIHFENCEIEES